MLAAGCGADVSSAFVSSVCGFSAFGVSACFRLDKERIDRFDHLFAGKHADQPIDPRADLQQGFAITLGQTAGHDDPAQMARRLETFHLSDDPDRLLSGALDEPTGVDQNQIGPFRLIDEAIPRFAQFA